MKTQLFGPAQIPVSRVALGCMGLAGTWNPAEVGPENIRKAIAAFEAAMEAGITFYDHADIYGATACESIFKECLAAVPGSREKIFIATKFGIRSGFYDHSPEHIKNSIHGSLTRMGIGYVDLYQIHRPDPFSHPAKTAEALDALVEEGLVKAIGVSNYLPHQVDALRKYLKAPIVSNQFRFSLIHLDPLYEGLNGAPGAQGERGDGVLDQCLEHGITPLAYSPLGKGFLSGHKEMPADYPHKERIERIFETMSELSSKYNGATPTQLATAWLLGHPSNIIPLIGSNDPEHIREGAKSTEIELSRTDWYALWTASRGVNVP